MLSVVRGTAPGPKSPFPKISFVMIYLSQDHVSVWLSVCLSVFLFVRLSVASSYIGTSESLAWVRINRRDERRGQVWRWGTLPTILNHAFPPLPSMHSGSVYCGFSLQDAFTLQWQNSHILSFWHRKAWRHSLKLREAMVWWKRKVWKTIIQDKDSKNIFPPSISVTNKNSFMTTELICFHQSDGRTLY